MATDSTVQALDEFATQAKNARQRFEPDWFLNVAYYQGEQWLAWGRDRLHKPQLEPWRVTFTDNRIIGMVRVEVAKMTKQRPAFVATPANADEASIEAAKLTEEVLQYLWKELDLQRRQRAALMWSRICGAGFWKIYWDAMAGQQIDVLLGPDGQPMLDPASQRPLRVDALGDQLPTFLEMGAQVKTIAEGQACVEVRSPFEMLADPLASEEGLVSAEWLVEETIHSLDWCRKRWPDGQFKEDADAVAGMAESRLGGPGMTGDGASQYKGVRLRELWHKPGSKFPKGKYVVWANDKVLHEEDLPYKDLPYVMFSGISVPGRFWPTSIVSQLRGPQTEFNKTRSQIRENINRFGNPALLMSRYANVDYTGVPGEQVTFDDGMGPNAIPRYLQPPEIPAYVVNELGMMEQSFREISGQHEITHGSVPPGVTAASAINLLQEQDDTRLGPDIADMERALAEAGNQIIQIVAANYDDERTLKIAGRDGDWDIRSFRGQMLSAPSVDVQSGSAMPQSKSAKLASMEHMLTLFIQNGVPMSPRQLAQYLQDMGVGGYERLIEQFSQDEPQINAEHRRLINGEMGPAQLNSYDDDEAHIAGHTAFQKSARYWRLEPIVKQAFEQHVALHRERFNAAQKAQQEQEIQMERELAKAQALAKPQPQPQRTGGIGNGRK